MRAAQDAGQEMTTDQLGLGEAEFADLTRELTQGPSPPLVVPAGLSDALTTLTELGLVAPTDPGEPTAGPTRPLWVAHRWTAAALARLAPDPEVAEAHGRAARYWRWRVAVWPQDRQADIADLLEARYHLQAAGDLDEVVQVTESVCLQLHTWGAWSWEEQLCRETVELVPNRSRNAAAFTHELGVIAQQRGDYDQALDWYRRSLAIVEELGDRVGVAISYHQLGMVAEQRGDYDQALDRYHQSLAIKEELGDRAGMANTISQIGVLLTEVGTPEDGLIWNVRSLGIRAELGVPQLRIDLHWLQRQRALLGARRFQRLLRQELGDQDSQRVMEWLRQLPDGE